jgi:hypothetical protein
MTISRIHAAPFFLALSLAACQSDPPADANLPDAPTPRDATIPVVPPTVVSTLPLSGAMDVARNSSASVTFSEVMRASSLGATTFTVTTGTPATLALGTVITAGRTATFWPRTHFPSDTTFTATITTGALNAAGTPLENNHVWSFQTGNSSAPTSAVGLGTADQYVVLAESEISNIPTSIITGDVGLSPAAARFITGFSLAPDATNVFARSAQITGRVTASDYASPTPTTLTVAVEDMERASLEASSRAADITDLGAGNVGGMSLARGVYHWDSALIVPSDITLTGNATDVWILYVTGDLTVSSNARVVLSGGARPENVFWQVGGMVALETMAHIEGVVLSETSITLAAGASVRGRLLAHTSVRLEGSTLVAPTE